MTTDDPTGGLARGPADRSGEPRTPTEALAARALRGAPRGAEVVLAAARSGTRTGLLELDANADHRRRWATVAAAAILVVGLAAGAIAVRSRDGERDPAVATGSAYCRALEARAVPPEGIDPDLSVYVTPASTAADIATVGEALRKDPRVENIHHVDATATLERFRRMFADEPAILASVGPEDLPTSYEVRLVDGVDLDDAVASFYDVPHVFDAVPQPIRHARVLDVLVASGHPFLQAGGPLAPDAPFTRPWPGLLAAVRGAAPTDAAGATTRLAAELDRRQGLGPSAQLETESALVADAELLTRSAVERCRLEPAVWASTSEQDIDRVLSDAQLLPPGPGPETTTTTSTTTVPGGG